MVKKVAPPAGSPVHARGVKKQGSKARSPRKPRNKLLNVLAKACSICRQTTHDADRDFREFVWLEWTQRHFTKDGAEHPSGNECYCCFHCRRRHFKEFKTLKNLRGEMEKDPSLRDKFEEVRKDDIRRNSMKSFRSARGQRSGRTPRSARSTGVYRGCKQRGSRLAPRSRT